MPKLPRISGKDAVKVFKKLGWEVSRQISLNLYLTTMRIDIVMPNKKHTIIER